MPHCKRLFQHEAAGGIVLILAAGAALALANSPLAGAYNLLLSLRTSVRIGDFAIEKPLGSRLRGATHSDAG